MGPIGVVIAITAAIVLVADQLVKAIVSEWLGRGASTHRWELLGRWFAFEYSENTGAAFGIFAGQTMLLSAVAVVVTGVFLYSMRDQARDNRILLLAVGVVLGGALGNLIDRVRLGYVVDFIRVGIWPNFNLADSSIVVGLCLMAFVAFTAEDSESRGEEADTGDATRTIGNLYDKENGGATRG